MAVKKNSPPIIEPDLEATAELPVLEFEDADAVDTDAADGESVHPTDATDVSPILHIPAGAAELAELTDHLRDVEQQLRRKSERVDLLEAELAAAQAQSGDLRAQVGQLQSVVEQLQSVSAARESALQQEIGAAVRHNVDPQRHQERDLLELRRRSERQHEALSTWQGYRAVSESMLAECEAQFQGMDARHAAAMQEALAEGKRLQDELAAVVQHQVDELRAREEQVRAAAELCDEQQRQIASLQAQIAAANERLHEADAQLRTAAERVQRPDHSDAGPRQELPAATGAVALRVLIRREGGSEIVYPLGRRTGIGRTPDNDIQVNATWVSRHHAVLLSSPDHCIVEDLNSTNGVLVNGRRVDRQILHDGDKVTVGKSEFRYQQRS